MSFISHARAANPETKAATHPHNSGTNPIEEATSPKSFASSRKAAKIAGIETIKENSPASLRFTPLRSAPVIVEPERETPGNVPTPCIKPITAACFAEIPVQSPFPAQFSELRFFCNKSEIINNNAVKMKPAQITFTGISGINLLVAIPITPVIKVAIIIATIVFRLNLSLPVRPSEFSESEKLSALSDFPAFL